MTFEMWCERVENIVFEDLSLPEKNSLGSKFFAYLRENFRVEVADHRGDTEPCLIVPALECALT